MGEEFEIQKIKFKILVTMDGQILKILLRKN